jgi:hypothetical protein
MSSSQVDLHSRNILGTISSAFSSRSLRVRKAWQTAATLATPSQLFGRGIWHAGKSSFTPFHSASAVTSCQSVACLKKCFSADFFAQWSLLWGVRPKIWIRFFRQVVELAFTPSDSGSGRHFDALRAATLGGSFVLTARPGVKTGFDAPDQVQNQAGR